MRCILTFGVIRLTPQSVLGSGQKILWTTGANRSKQTGMAIRTIVVLLVGLGFASVHLAEGQQPPTVPRIGYVSGTSNPSNPGPYVEALRQGLRDLGHIDGKNIVIEYRGAEGEPGRYQSLVNDLVQLKVDILVVPALPAIRAARQATKTIPIVMVTNTDPVAHRLVDSLARPGGNITGISTLAQDLSGKRLELLTKVVPAALTCRSSSGCGQSKFGDCVQRV
jgi:putative ABC transport system substrate-binding protein